MRKLEPRESFRHGKERASLQTSLNLGAQIRTTFEKVQTQNLDNLDQKTWEANRPLGFSRSRWLLAFTVGNGDLGRGLLTLCFILNHVLPEAPNEFLFLAVHKLLFQFV